MDAMTRWHEKGETGTSRDDYLPKTVNKKYKPLFQPAETVRWQGEGQAQVEWKNAGPVDLIAKVQADQQGELEFARFYFPGWKALVNGKPVKIRPREYFGTILVPVDSGKNEIVLKFDSTPLRTTLGWISFSALCGLILFAIFGCLQNHRTNSDASV